MIEIVRGPNIKKSRARRLAASLRVHLDALKEPIDYGDLINFAIWNRLATARERTLPRTAWRALSSPDKRFVERETGPMFEVKTRRADDELVRQLLGAYPTLWCTGPVDSSDPEEIPLITEGILEALLERHHRFAGRRLAAYLASIGVTWPDARGDTDLPVARGVIDSVGRTHGATPRRLGRPPRPSSTERGSVDSLTLVEDP
jgi:hypothetical protein